ncbi:hypothetical protein GmHk_20G057466 [Glycine max]|nr:hypothetical protein GmHk_20G057466 [Glycine max]
MSDGFCGTHLQIMVRTRGLGSALGHVTARGVGRGDHDDSDDAPQRRRPTASAQRQRVAVTAAHDEPVIPTPDVQDDPMEAPAALEDILADTGASLTSAEEPRHAVEVCDDIAERLERHLSLGVVTPGSSTHEVIEECFKLARSVTQDHLVYVRSRHRRRTDQA